VTCRCVEVAAVDAIVWLLVLGVPALVLIPQLLWALGRRGLSAAAGVLVLLACAWWLFDRSRRAEGDAAPPDRTQFASVSSDTCFKCHEEHYASWRRTYHRSMTREATPENIRGDFDNVVYHYRGTTTRLTRQGDAFFMETVDPVWAERAAKTGKPLEQLGPAPTKKFQVARLVGSHWFQECLYKDEAGRYWRLPVSYHIVEGRWVHTNGAFLVPDTDEFYSKSTIWNENCVFCHNTKPSKRPQPPTAWDPKGGYRTEVAELGIACEACHGPGGEHVRANQNPARRLALHHSGQGDPTIVNPRRLSVERGDAVCAHCHGATVPKPRAWDPVSITEPYIAGEDLMRFYSFFWSEAEQEQLNQGGEISPRAAGAKSHASRPAPVPGDGRFWGDGTPLTTALEYNGMALSACYQAGHGSLTCIKCHDAHPKEPNFMLRPGMETNDACYQCHDGYRDRLAEHTHHPAGSSGSLCYNCHMAYQVYSLLTIHRSHRIESPTIEGSLGTGKPHACNLCHLDKSLGWTQERLVQWYGRKPLPLSPDETKHASSLLHLTRGDARSRGVVAGAFSWPAALEASGTDWQGPILARLLESESYPAVRYLLHRGLRKLYGNDEVLYEYQASPAQRRVDMMAVRARLDARRQPRTDLYPNLPLGPSLEATLKLLLKDRDDPDVFVQE
jgi:predicted CXXCH cytochrome family protein